MLEPDATYGAGVVKGAREPKTAATFVDEVAATGAVDTIVKKYATSDSAPEAYVLAGRLALGRSHQGADIDAALANFERVFRLFPTSPAVPRALALAGETMWYARRPDVSSD